MAQQAVGQATAQPGVTAETLKAGMDSETTPTAEAPPPTSAGQGILPDVPVNNPSTPPSDIDPAAGSDQTIGGGTGSTGATSDSLNAQTEVIDDAITQNDAAKAEAKAAADAAQKEKDRLALELEDTEGDITEIAEDLYAESEIEETQAALLEVKNQLIALEQKLGISLAQLENQSIPMEFIVGQQALLQRQTLAKSQYLVSKGALLQDQMNFAKDELNFYFDAAVADHQVKVSNLRLLLGYAQDELISLTDRERDLADRTIDLELSKAEQIDAEKDKITELMANNPEAWAKANISLDMPYAEMVEELVKVAEEVEAEAFEITSVRELINKYPDAQINQEDTLLVAQGKLGNSKIYQQATRLAGGGGSGGGGDIPQAKGVYLSSLQATADRLSGLRDNTQLTDSVWQFELETMFGELYNIENMSEEGRNEAFDQMERDVQDIMGGRFGQPAEMNIDEGDDNIGSDISLMPTIFSGFSTVQGPSFGGVSTPAIIKPVGVDKEETIGDRLRAIT